MKSEIVIQISGMLGTVRPATTLFLVPCGAEPYNTISISFYSCSVVYFCRQNHTVKALYTVKKTDLKNVLKLFSKSIKINAVKNLCRKLYFSRLCCIIVEIIRLYSN